MVPLVRLSIVIWLLAPLAGLLQAQPLVDRVPAGVELYFAWRGSDNLLPQYGGSHLQGVVNASQFPEAFEQTWPKIVERVAKEDPRASEALEEAGQVIRLSWRYPTVLFGSGMGEDLRAGIMVQAGADVPKLIEQFRELAATPRAGIPVKVFQLDDLAVITIGYEQEQMALAGAGENRPQPITTDARFTRAMEQVQKDSAVVVYANFTAAAERARRMLEQEQAPISSEQEIRLNSLKAASHLMESLEGFVWTAGFDGKGWRTETFVSAPAPRKGLAGLLDAKPLSGELLQAIPRSADWVVVSRLDLARLLKEARATATAMGPEAIKAFDQVQGASTLALGTNLEQNLFEPLGDEWAVYISPTEVGPGFMSAVMINRVDDPAKVNRALSSIAIAGTNVFTNAMRRTKMSMQVRTVDHKGTRISYLPTPLVAPTWAIRGNLLYVGLYPQTVAGALDAAEQSDSILDSEAFQAARKRLPDREITSVSFVDLPVTTRQSYPALLMIFQTYSGFADLFDAAGQPLLLPTLSDLQPHLTPAARVAWVDDAGWHAQSFGPFPMSGMLAGEFNAIAGQAPLIAAAMLPALMAAQEQARDVQTMANLRQIGMAMMLYSNENRAALPPDLGELVKGGYITGGQVFLSARSTVVVPPDLEQRTPEQQAEWIRENTSFIYVRPVDRLPKIKNASGTVIVYENPQGVTPEQEVGVLFVDGHAESMSIERLNQLLAQQGAKVD